MDIGYKDAIAFIHSLCTIKLKIRRYFVNFNIKELDKDNITYIENQLENFDKKYITNEYNGGIYLGYYIKDNLIGGIIAEITTFNILYISTLFVEEKYRRQGIGKTLIEETEKIAKSKNVNTIRLDTFDWQGKDFYLAMKYKLVGSYHNAVDNYSEYFF